MAQHMTRPAADGGFRLAYDPGIAHPFRTQPARDVDIWPAYERIRVPTLVLRGAESGLLPDETAQRMTARGPKAELAVIADAAHAPALMDRGQIALVAEFLDRD